MKINSIYMQQQRTARRIAEFINRYPAVVSVVWAVMTVYSAYMIFMYA